MERSRELGMRTFDWSLFGLYNEGHIGYEDALLNADSANELRLNIKLKSARGEPATIAGAAFALHEQDDAPTEQELHAARQREMQRQRARERERVELLHLENARQQEKRVRLENEQLAVLRSAKQPLELQIVSPPKPAMRAIAPELTIAAL